MLLALRDQAMRVSHHLPLPGLPSPPLHPLQYSMLPACASSADPLQASLLRSPESCLRTRPEDKAEHGLGLEGLV